MSAELALPVERHVLGCGLPVLLVPRRQLHRACVSLYLRVGSRYETSAENGISHFLEHMLYRGTPRHPTAHEQALAFERLGGTLYAATATDHGWMTISLPPETLLEALPLLAEVALEPTFSALEVERRIVHEEILESLDDDGRPIDADNLTRALLYGEHPLGFPITGTPTQLDRFDEPMLRAHHARHYKSQNAVLVVAGAFAPKRALATLERAFAPMKKGKRVKATAVAPAKKNGEPRFRFVESDGSQTDLRVAFRAPGDHARDEPATEALLRVIDDGMATRLYERICDSKGLCYDVSAAFEAYEDDGVFDFAAECQHARTHDVAAEIFAIVRELAEHGPTDREVDLVRSRARWSTRSMLDDADELAAFHGLAALAGVAPTPAERCAELCDVTKEQIRATASRIFHPSRLATVAVGLLSRAEEKRLANLVAAFR